MDVNKAYDELVELIKSGTKHEFHDECKVISDWGNMVLSTDSEDQKKEVLSYRIRETKEQKEQRLNLTNSITSVIANPIYNYFSEIKRVDGIHFEINHSDNKLQKEIEDKFEKYYANESLYDYLFDTILYYNKYDPNAWIIFERRNKLRTDGTIEDIELYPFEVLNQQAVDYSYKNGILESLTVCVSIKAKKTEGSGDVELLNYYKYIAGTTIHFAEQNNEAADNEVYEGYELLKFKNDSKEKSFWVKSFETNTTEVPAIRVGAYFSGKHKRKICETPIHPAKPVFSDLIRDKSHLDVTKVLHAIPRLFEYVKPCTHQSDEGVNCKSGYYGGIREEKSMCEGCQGVGYQLHTSEQDAIRLVWPKDANDVIDLQKLSHYEIMDLEVPKFLREEVQKAQQLAHLAVFNQEAFDKTATIKTATEINVNYSKIYNKLNPFANKIIEARELAVRVAFQYFDKGEDLMVNMAYPLDYKLKTTEELILDYQSATTAGMPYEAVSTILHDFMDKKYSNKPDVVKQMKAFEKFKPFKDKTTSEIQVILQSRAKDDYHRVLWENFDLIKQGIINDTDPKEVKFAEFKSTAQGELIKKEVEKMAQEIKAPSNPISALNESFLIGG